MKTMSVKIREIRNALGMEQQELGNLVGVSSRSIIAYEKGEKHPRERTIFKLAKALHVSIKFLKDDECENPTEDIEKDAHILEMSDKYGISGARDMERLLSANQALFAGGEYSQEQKDKFFMALTAAYESCREEAKEVYGKKKKKK